MATRSRGRQDRQNGLLGRGRRDRRERRDLADPEAQIAQVFKNVRRIVEQAGGTVADIAKLDVKLRDMSDRPIVNKYWLELFPDEHDRPVRHTTQADLAGTLAIQVEVVAVLDERCRVVWRLRRE